MLTQQLEFLNCEKNFAYIDLQLYIVDLNVSGVISLICTRVLTWVELAFRPEPSSNPPMDVG